MEKLVVAFGRFDVVQHPLWGRGIVQDFSGGLLLVRFNPRYSARSRDRWINPQSVTLLARGA